MRERITTALDILGATGLSVAAGAESGWPAGVAVAAVCALLASWRLA